MFVATPICDAIIGAAKPQTYPIIAHNPFAVALIVEEHDSGVYAY